MSKTNPRRFVTLCVSSFFVVVLSLLPATGWAALQAAAPTANSVTLTWTAPGDDGDIGTASQYDVRYSFLVITEANWDAAIQVFGEPSPQPGGTAETFDVVGLEPSTSYYFAIKVADEVPNWSALSNVVQKTTLDEATPPATIVNLITSAPGTSSLTINWTAPGDDDNTGTASLYDIRYATSNITDANWDLATILPSPPAPQAAGANESVIISGLDPSTRYYFAIKTADEVPNWSSLSNVASGTTGSETIAPAVIADLVTSNFLSTEMTLSWTAPGDDNNSGTASQYDLRYSLQPIVTGNDWNNAIAVGGLAAPQVAGSAESFVVSSLSPLTQYYFAIRTADEVPNWSGISNVATGTTINETTPPDVIVNLGANNPTSSSLRLSWTAPGDDGAVGTATEYDIRYSTSVINGSNWNSATQVIGEPAPLSAGQLEQFVVTGLDADQRYYFAIRTADEIPNWSDLSNIANSSTLPDGDAPADIGTLIAVLPTNSTMTLVWTAPGDDGNTGQATQYDVRYDVSTINNGNWSSATQVSTEPLPSVAGTPESLTVVGLTPGTMYYFCVRAVDEAGNWSGLSNVASNVTAGDVTPPSAIGDLAAITGSANGEINLSWTAPGDDGSIGQAMTYLIRYSIDSITDENWEAADKHPLPPVPQMAGSSEATTITGLSPAQTYFAAVRTFDDAGNLSALSNVSFAEAYISISTGANDMATPTSPPPFSVLSTSRPDLIATNPVSTDNILQFELATDADFFGMIASGAIDQQLGDVTVWEVPTALEVDNEYFWRVITNSTEFSPTSSFTVEPHSFAYPNPVNLTSDPGATFTELPAGSELMLTSVSGEIVRRWTRLTGEDVVWDGTNASGAQVASGAYLWYLADAGNGPGSRGKLIVVR